MSWRVKSEISNRYLISTLWLNLNTWVEHLDSTWILESRILTQIESWRVENSTRSQWLNSSWSVYKQRLEKKNKIAYALVAWSKKKKKQSYYNSQSMKLNATRKILMNACDKTVQQSKACYTCKKLNHFFKDCIQNKYKNKLKFYNK